MVGQLVPFSFGLLRAMCFVLCVFRHPRPLHSFPTRRSSDLTTREGSPVTRSPSTATTSSAPTSRAGSETTLSPTVTRPARRSEEHTSELQSRVDLVCRLLLEKKKETLTRSVYRSGCRAG